MQKIANYINNIAFYAIMDSKNSKILAVLSENSSLPVNKIAKLVKLPITTVHHRIKKLVKEEIIKKYTIKLNHKKLGNDLFAYIFISADKKLLKEKNKTQYDVANTLMKLPYVTKVDIVIGQTDIIIQVIVKDMEELDRVLLGEIQKIEGIVDTHTSAVLREFE
jgi:DNA-binding Lrp family transcriptional regulator